MGRILQWVVGCTLAFSMLTAAFAGSGTFTYQYDALGRLTVLKSPEGIYTEYSYDPAGNRSTYTTGEYLALSYANGRTNLWNTVGVNSDSGAWVNITNSSEVNVTLTNHTFTGGATGFWAWSSTTTGTCSFGSMTSPATILVPGQTCQTFVGIGASSPALGTYTATETTSYQVAGLAGTYAQIFSPAQVTLASTSQSTSTLNIGATSVGYASVAKTITYTNQAINGGPLKSVKAILSGAQAGNFTISSNTCGTGAGTIAAGGTCTVGITLNPSSTIAYAASVILTGGYDRMQPDDSGYMPTTTGVNLTATASGSGVAGPSVITAAFNVSTVTSGGTATFTWATSGAASATVACAGAATGSASGTSGSLAVTTSGTGTGTCTVTATGTGGVAATKSATITVTAPPSFTFAPTIAANTMNYNLKVAAIAAGWDQVKPLNATVTINSGVMIGSTLTAAYAFDTGATFPVGTTLKLVNNGKILGMGGAGGAGGNATPGGAGGPALRAQFMLTITNNGIIGGGGGGGAGVSGSNTPGGCGGQGFNGGAGGAGGYPYGNTGMAGTPTAPGGATGPAGSALGAAGVSTSVPGGAGGACTSGNASITWTVLGSRYGALN